MKYDFDKIDNRKDTGSIKWDMMNEFYGRDDLIPLWIADMDFPVAKEIKEAIKERADHEYYGYSKYNHTLKSTIVKRFKDKFNWEIKPEWIVITPGVIPALHVAIRSLSQPGDNIIIQEPVYHLFFPTVRNSGCHIVTNPLKLENGEYHMDLNHLKSLFEDEVGHNPFYKPIKAILLCNPHNPIGKEWSKEELIEAGKIAIKNGLKIVVDEIHSELLFYGKQHTSFGSISKEFEQNSIISFSATKTFNLAGLHVGVAIIPNDDLRKEFISTMDGIVPEPSIFALTALEASLKHGDEWLNQVLKYLEGNLELLYEELSNINGITAIKADGTYLIWLDCRKLGLSHEELSDFFINKAKVALEDGILFGHGGEGFMRINIAIPKSLLKEGLKRIKDAINEL
ncbi:MalY/PatB family protein [Methanobrevibacter curvatus]|uniref:cysteine-S-conjugate beta-lyase n=1 Tax=Methanobrevibacter curvatus TaxID=49547 RepID=A0A166CIE6_9EURY|nr:MalY/PatB family protein [Methanobrevibacter curvatus]KZX14541.1 cystathionine beta-lyase PatB [Methanobrevibacter curvatus]